MKKKISPMSLLWISLTSMIGSGWLFGSLYSAHFAGPAAILAWPIAGFLLLFVAFSYAELGTMFPQSDTLARLPLYTHGKLTSMVMNGLAWISLATIPVIETQGLIQYANNYFPYLVIHDDLHYSTTTLGYGIALTLLLSFVILNYFGISLFSRINAGFTLWKLLIPTITLISLLCFSYHENNLSQYGGFMPYGWEGVMAAMSSGGVLFSLLGFRQVIVMMGESENPGKYVPIVLVSSLLITTLLYTGLQWSFIGSMREQDLIHGWTNLSFSGDAGPFAALASFAGLIWLSSLLYSDAFISPYSTGLVYSTTAAHMLASISSIGDAPQQLSIKNTHEVPWVSLCINFLLAVMMFLLLRDWQEMAAFLVAVLMISYAVGPICLICLRNQIPLHHRPFRVRYGNFIAFLGFYICTAGVYWTGMMSIFKLLFITFLGALIYFVYKYFAKQSQDKYDSKNAVWLLCYLLMLGIFSYFGNYGGHHWISPYLDLFYLFLLSFIIFIFAYLSKKPSEYTQAVIKQ